MRESPFIFEDAVPADKFFDRKEELEYFTRHLRVKRKMLLCIVAPLKYGKTSLMLRYYEMLKSLPDVVPVYINLKNVEEPIRYLVAELKSCGVDLESEYEAAKSRGVLSSFFSSAERKLGGRWLFLLFDEFHLLPSRVRAEGFLTKFSDDEVFGFFRGYAEGRRISYVVCGSVIEPLMRALDIWGGRFQILYLGPFNEEDSVTMLKKLFAEGGMEIRDEEARVIAEAAGYHPFYMQYMGHQIFTMGRVDRASIRRAKQMLFEFLSPLFFSYLERIRELGPEYLEAMAKLLKGAKLTLDDMVLLGRLVRIGILRPKNSRFELVDPLFKRYIELVLSGYEPAEVAVVGHWAERIVGNYLLRKGYLPYYSHDSWGAFDIYARVQGTDVGVQVKYSTSGTVRLSEEEADRMVEASRETGWIPILAVVSNGIRFFGEIRAGTYRFEDGLSEIEDALGTH